MANYNTCRHLIGRAKLPQLCKNQDGVKNPFKCAGTAPRKKFWGSQNFFFIVVEAWPGRGEGGARAWLATPAPALKMCIQRPSKFFGATSGKNHVTAGVPKSFGVCIFSIPHLSKVDCNLSLIHI